MGIKQNFKIIGSGSYYPKRIVTAEEIDRRVKRAPGWTESHLGVRTRHECVAPETMVTMGCHAIESAINDAGIGWGDVDYVIDCSTSKFRPIPCNAAHFQQSIGAAANGVPCIDLQSTCLGSILAVQFSNALFTTGAYRHILIVASESALQGVDWCDPKSAGLFGDGAAALVLRYSPSDHDLLFAHETFAEHLDLCKVDGGGHFRPSYQYRSDDDREYRFQMDGRNVFRVALRLLPPMVQKMKEAYLETNVDGINCLHVIPHQASPKAVELVRRIIDIPKDRYHVAIREIGNMVAASIPAMIDRVRKSNLLPEQAPLMLLGTSAGYSQAAIIFHS
ncbi:3-oxoacyl-ACP synthase III family protein [Roseiconus lacunae]|uniref:3-oxoacyl-ACP synthase III family protein n=1 Tax=Roseiconus lacunae TaxID=2605694 RepID=UPI001E4AC07D|nr:3-oxoacyl-[acyl-carrier-protein] synthase III C-terminal domain-containing protein [Roseiconus lacunae]